MRVNTLFPSKISDKGEVKGGIVLIKLEEKEESINGKIELEVSYKDRNGKDIKILKLLILIKIKQKNFMVNLE